MEFEILLGAASDKDQLPLLPRSLQNGLEAGVLVLLISGFLQNGAK